MILKAHSNLTCGKNIGNASNASSQEIMSVVFQGLEGYSRDPGFDQNTVRDSGKQKIS